MVYVGILVFASVEFEDLSFAKLSKECLFVLVIFINRIL
jgi:hypothetical protein